MTEQKQSPSRTGLGWIFFLVGFIGSIVLGWVVFPGLLYSEKSQPINFSHAKHSDSSCEDCHTLRPDGSFTGIPKIQNCIECHQDPQGDSKDEQILIEKYIQEEKEIPWLVYTRQPDNVYFSHAPHMGKDMKCTTCHRDVSAEEKSPAVKVNRLTGYHEDTMMMVECEKCHARQGTTNACAACHK